MSESDGVDEAVEGLSRTAIAVAGRLGEKLAKVREQSLREQHAVEEQRGRELRSHYESQRAAARAQLAPTAEDRWWDQARPQDIERVHETAIAWKQFDSTAQEAAERIRREVRERYRIDVDNPGADDRTVSEALVRAERDRSEADRQRNAADQDGAEAAALLIGVASREDRGRESEVAVENGTGQEAQPLYDSEERRQSFAASLDGKADTETIRARILADRDQAAPPSAAVAGELGKVKKPVKRGPGAGRQQKVQPERSR